MLHATRDPSPTFGSGALEPYANALRDPSRSLSLHRMTSRPGPADTGNAAHGITADGFVAAFGAAGSGTAESTALLDPHPLDVRKFLAPSDRVDDEVLEHCVGPILDVGCGPGRIVQSAILAGHIALGIDVSTTAVGIAQERGLPVLCRSVFQELPAEGTWGTVVVLDGNIGIGGDPLTLLQRCADLILANGQGRIVVEVHNDPNHDHAYQGVVVDDLAQHSLPFPWAELGVDALQRHAEDAGLTLLTQWQRDGRAFALYCL